MKRKEYVQKFFTKCINDNSDGGVDGCPYEYEGMEYLMEECDSRCKGQSDDNCFMCWNTELNE